MQNPGCSSLATPSLFLRWIFLACGWGVAAGGVPRSRPSGLVHGAFEIHQLGCMAGQGAASGADDCDSLIHPPSRGQYTKGTLHLRAQLTNSPRPSQHILSNRKHKQGFASNLNTVEGLRSLVQLRLLILLTILLKLLTLLSGQ